MLKLCKNLPVYQGLQETHCEGKVQLLEELNLTGLPPQGNVQALFYLLLYFNHQVVNVNRTKQSLHTVQLPSNQQFACYILF